jgi:NTP pyrophosphatase (non-canonical NTP hydrolase)
VKSLAEWQEEVHRIAVSKGFDVRTRNVAESLCLMHSEISEAMECWRDSDIELRFDENGKPEGLKSELADVVIRVMDFMEGFGMDLERAIALKSDYNQRRPLLHGRVR